MSSGKNRDRSQRQAGVPEDDVRLFREAVRDTKPISPPDRITHTPKPAPVPIQSLLDSHEALADSLIGAISPEQSMETGEELVFLRPSLPLNVLRQLRRGRWVVQDALDLHGLTQVQARAALADFFAECLRRRLRCVRIVHGKGLRSPNREPVLKGKLHLWLAHRNEILAYCQAPQNLGGSGALLVLLSA
jgi:DNA-nicking Smr family endonuclease